MTAGLVDRAAVRVLARRTEGLAVVSARRFWQETFAAGLVSWWRRKAAEFEWCRPRPDDFNGRATAEDLAARDARLAHLAELCREHARLIEEANGAEMAAELADLLAAEGVA